MKTTKRKPKVLPPVEDSSVMFSDQLSDFRLSPKDHPENRNLEVEMFGKKGVEAMIDAFEEQVMGIPKPKVEKRKYNCRVLNAGHDEDEQLLNQLMNDPKYHILSWKDTWTVHGDYKVFVIYFEVIKPKDENEGTPLPSQLPTTLKGRGLNGSEIC